MRQSGALRIFLYNWPIYVATWSFALVIPWVVRAIDARLFALALLPCGIAIAWSIVSLAVSFYIYDRSALVGGAWVPSLLGSSTLTWATIHAGLDAEVDLDRVMTGRCVARLDVFDRTIMTAPSIERARARTPQAHHATCCPPTALALTDQACDAVVVAFTAHEIRDVVARERFFHELWRSVRPGGRVLVVEHLRDFANFLVFGPGFLHFLPRSEWLRLASDSKFTVADERRVTPWVMALALERAA